ncbi:MAG: phage recombination protein Bet [Micrococcales bacterium]|nr:phage recombination protein Bet [Micrococcales bacterium]
MSTDVVVRGPASDLAIVDGQTFFSDKQVAALRQLGVQGATNADLAVFFHQCARTGLDPFARQVYMIERQGRQTIQTGIDGFRLVARRAVDATGGTLGYEDTVWCGTDGVWTDVWLAPGPPAAAKVVVLRDGQRFAAVALLGEYVGTRRDGSPTSMWASRPALMLAKCAEALALRKAFPQDLSGLYTSDETNQADHRPGSGVAALRESVPHDPGPVVTDAEIVEDDQPAPSITPAQQRKLHAMLRQAVGDDRDAGLVVCSSVLSRDVTSTADLTVAEASTVIDALEADRTAADTDPWPDAQTGEASA